MMRSDLISPAQPQPRRLRFSVDDYYKMIEMGMIEDYEKSEIIDGELVPKMSIGDKHAWIVDFLTRYFILNLPKTIFVRTQNPLRLSDFDEPEPDLVLTDLRRYDGKRHPRPAETLLVIEVADASLRYDRNEKLSLYAQSGISEAWIVNIPHNTIEVHQNPSDGIYQKTDIFRAGDMVVSSVLPDLTLSVDEVLS
jgi:Uma2 family endonuclease